MNGKNHQELQSQIRDEAKVLTNARVLEMYIDLSVRGIISFLTLGMFSYFVLLGLLGLPIQYVLPIIFLLSIFTAPLLSKIKLGEKVQNKYDDFLRNVIYHMNKYGKK